MEIRIQTAKQTSCALREGRKNTLRWTILPGVAYLLVMSPYKTDPDDDALCDYLRKKGFDEANQPAGIEFTEGQIVYYCSPIVLSRGEFGCQMELASYSLYQITKSDDKCSLQKFSERLDYEKEIRIQLKEDCVKSGILFNRHETKYYCVKIPKIEKYTDGQICYRFQDDGVVYPISCQALGREFYIRTDVRPVFFSDCGYSIKTES